MKIILAITTAAFLASSAAAQSLEALRFSADAALLEVMPLAIHPDLLQAQEPTIQKPLNPLPRPGWPTRRSLHRCRCRHRWMRGSSSERSFERS